MPVKHLSPRTSKLLLWSAVGVGGAVAVAVLALGVAVAFVYPSLPDVSTLANYQPKMPLRVFTSDSVLIGEFGEERRTLTPLSEVPKAMKDAVIAVEDARFYEHGGIDTIGVVRAMFANLHGMRQGASTITQQVARNVYLSSERTFSRKLREALISFELERKLSKDQILEIYLNQIYLGNRAYGFASASETYFGKPLQQVTLAEAAMLAGLPKAPTANNPLANPRRARARQLYVLDRMQQVGVATAAQVAQAKEEPLHLRDAADPDRLHAEYVAETVRQTMFAQYGDATYTRGFNVYTSLASTNQMTAYKALRKGVMDYERRQPYRGPEATVPLPAGSSDSDAVDDAIDSALASHADNGELLAAVVLDANPKDVTVVRADGEPLHVTGEGLRLVQPALTSRAAANIRVARGAVVRIARTAKGGWEITQLPEVEGAFVALDPRDGAVKALVGGFDYGKSQFNHVTQAWRQPGSTFKPFIYSAALEKGFTAGTVVNDSPLSFDPSTTGGKAWEPKNSDGVFDGPMTLRHALEKSKNMVTIRVLQSIGPSYAQDWVSHFGFDPDKQPAYLPMALGAGSVTPMQMAAGYGAFANGGYRVTPQLITRVTDAKGNVLTEAQPPVHDDSTRAISERNAFMVSSLLQSVIRNGTGAKAYQAIRRDDIYGKTGTTNDSYDAWFAGFQPNMVAVTWIGYDTPRQLGVRGETGASVALPVWTSYMQAALRGEPVVKSPVPKGIAMVDGEWYFDEYTPGKGVQSLGVDAPEQAEPESASGAVGGFLDRIFGGGDKPAAPAPTPPQDRNRILDLFR